MPTLDFLVLVFEAVKPVFEPLPICIDTQRDATCGRQRGGLRGGVGGGGGEGESSAKHLSCTDDIRNINKADARGRLGVLATGSQKSGTDLALKDDEVDECWHHKQTAFVKGFMLNSNCLFINNE